MIRNRHKSSDGFSNGERSYEMQLQRFLGSFAGWILLTRTSRGPSPSVVMLAAAVTAGVTSSAVSAAERLPAALEGLGRVPAASQMEAA